MWSKWLCVCAAVFMVFVFCMGCEEETVEKKTPPQTEKAEAKPAQAKRITPKAEPTPPPPAKQPAPKPAPKPPKKTEVTVAKVTPPAPKKTDKPAPKKPAPKPVAAKPEKKVTPPKPKAPPPIGPFKAADKVWVIDDFASGQSYWRAEAWANPAKLTVAKGELKAELQKGDKDKSALSRTASLNMSDRSKLILDVRNNTKKDVKVAVAFMTGGTPTFIESEMVTAKPGLNKNVTFDLGSDKFKTAATKWEHRAKLSGADAVKTVTIMLYGDGQGEVCLDNIRLEK